ncbi:MAG: response regulator transcription factor [Actinobacteria bacterium]|nr:response regulator transcription factor [Actinomycetota bacterium]
MRTNAVLLADPELDSRAYLERHLSDDGFHVIEAGWSSQALDLAERTAPDIVVAGEPDLCARLREGEPGRRWDRNVPVIVLTKPGSDAVDRVRAFEKGADDVVDRFLYLELVARIRALLRRTTVGQADRMEVGELVVDLRARQVSVGEVVVSFSAREFDVVARLASSPGRVFTRAELHRDVWGIRYDARTRMLDSHICRIRRKLDDAAAPITIENVWGRGFRLRADLGC